MATREPYKKVFGQIETALDKIEQELSQISDNIFLLKLERFAIVFSAFLPLPIFQINTRAKTLQKLTGRLEKIRAQLEMARAIHKIPYNNGGMKSPESDESTALFSKKFHALLYRIEDVESIIVNKRNGFESNNEFSPDHENSKQSWSEIELKF